MKTSDLIGSAISNTFRSKTRTILTILAIFVGAFTLTLTSGLGTGINAYIADTVAGVGASDAMTVSKTNKDATGSLGPNSSEPRKYDPNAVSSGIPGQTVLALTPDDINTLKGIDGVRSVDAIRTITPDYIQAGDGTQFVASVGSLVPGQTAVLATGSEPDPKTTDPQIALPVAYVKPLGFDTNKDAIGQTITIGITDAERHPHTLEATVVGVTEEALASPTGSSILINNALSDALFTAQTTGLTPEQADRYASATVWFNPDATDKQIHALKDRLTDKGFTGTTIADRLGMITTVIDGIVLVLNAFAIIALLAAAFGIVNTLYMSVQERTREIGLMKAMGMGSGRIFTIFSLEAAFLGLLGSAIGAGIAMLAGTGISRALSAGLLANLPGLTLIAFDPASIAIIIILVMVIAFLSGTLPAARAARKDPVDALRYE
ncbi:ABC transporter permease YtrF precursor [Microbacterium azadirachtae]|uniref:ABC transporter permease YtrF n=1 Tax=Microbacterium azadirachtae TaxID=582680 RepID=A0A0F0KW64_9MICO|nr:ABC transporter permease [Microbacterium azadirachtae]KJL24335.1 ABC transporter permease YtrF precursor [Microbacterium azadirachtae]